MNLTESPDAIVWPATHYVYVEKIGPFQDTAAQAWRELHALQASLREHDEITGAMALYKLAPQKIYRAGFMLAQAANRAVMGLEYVRFAGGKYARFVLKGPYSDLPMACGRVFQIVAESKIPQRDDFCIEHYVNDPRTTPEEQLITEILIPTQ